MLTELKAKSAADLEIFIAMLGACNIAYAEATWTQRLPDWIGAHVRMFRFWAAAPDEYLQLHLSDALWPSIEPLLPPTSKVQQLCGLFWPRFPFFA